MNKLMGTLFDGSKLFRVLADLLSLRCTAGKHHDDRNKRDVLHREMFNDSVEHFG
jgi:hypothetical protein